MGKERLTEQEQRLLQTQEGAFAVIFGYLKLERGKISPAVFSKFSTQLGYPKVTKDDLISFVEKLRDNKEIDQLCLRAFRREITLDDVPSALAEATALPESDIFASITNFLVVNEDNNARLRELRKLQREGVYMKLLMDGVKKHLAEELKGMPRAKYIRTEPSEPKKGDKHLILLYADWHIGALVFNEHTGGYNFVKLTSKIQNTVNQVLDIVRTLEVTHIYVFHLGDLIEHVAMRSVNQAFDAEFTATEQIAKGTRLLVDTLATLSKEVHVTFGIVSGNHDRYDGNKNNKIYNDNAVYLILDTLFLLQEQFGQLPNVTLIDNRADTYEFIIKVAGKTIKVKHGDHENKKDDVKIPKHIKEEPIDYYIMGHIHSTRIVQEDYARFHIYVSSPMGANTFSKELNLPTTYGSQMLMILTEGFNSPMFIPMFDI